MRFQGDESRNLHLNTEPSFDLNELEKYLQNLPPIGLIKSSRIKLDGTDRMVLSRDSLASWTLSSPFYGYDDTRNVWVERQESKLEK